MTQYNNIDTKLSSLELDKLKSATKIAIKVLPRLSSNIICNTTYLSTFPHKLLISGKQVSKICKAFAYNSSANINLKIKSLLIETIIATYFDSFGVEYISKDIQKFTGNKSNKANTYEILACDPIMRGCFCTL